MIVCLLALQQLDAAARFLPGEPWFASRWLKRFAIKSRCDDQKPKNHISIPIAVRNTVFIGGISLSALAVVFAILKPSGASRHDLYSPEVVGAGLLGVL